MTERRYSRQQRGRLRSPWPFFHTVERGSQRAHDRRRLRLRRSCRSCTESMATPSCSIDASTGRSVTTEQPAPSFSSTSPRGRGRRDRSCVRRQVHLGAQGRRWPGRPEAPLVRCRRHVGGERAGPGPLLTVLMEWFPGYMRGPSLLADNSPVRGDLGSLVLYQRTGLRPYPDRPDISGQVRQTSRRNASLSALAHPRPVARLLARRAARRVREAALPRARPDSG